MRSVFHPLSFGLSLVACGFLLVSALGGCSGSGATDPFGAIKNRRQPPGRKAPAAGNRGVSTGELVAKALSTGTSEDLWDVAWIRDSGGLAVGTRGTVLKFDVSGQADLLEVPRIQDLFGVCMSRANEGWVVGASGTVFQYDGTKLTEVETGLDADLYDCETMSNGWARAVGDGGVLVELSTEAALTPKKPIPFEGHIYDIEVAAFGHVYLAGANGVILYGDDDDQYTKQSNVVSHDLRGMVFQDVTRGWAVGAFGSVLRYADRGWEEVSTNPKVRGDLHGISFGNGRTVACGDNGEVIEIIKNQIRKIKTPARVTLRSIASTRKGFIMVGDQGKAYILAPQAKTQHLVLSAAASGARLGERMKFVFELNPGKKIEWHRIDIQGALPRRWYVDKPRVLWRGTPVPALPASPQAGSASPTPFSAPPDSAGPPKFVFPNRQTPGGPGDLSRQRETMVPRAAAGPSKAGPAWVSLGPAKGRGVLTGSYEVLFPVIEAKGQTSAAETLEIRVLLVDPKKKDKKNAVQGSWETFRSNEVKLTLQPPVEP